ncbi:MAG: crossover junction endodeoxyribonuclease RuvC [Spirochaetota bacterium]
MIILGIDPGLAQLGWGLITAGSQQARVMQYGTTVTKAGERLEDRVSQLAAQCSSLIETHHVDQIAIEDIYFVKNKVSALSVAKVIGAVYYCAGLAGIPVVTYSPLQIKTTITGIGRAEKAQVQEMIRILLGMVEIPAPDHAADALAAALCHFTHMIGNARLESV